MAIDLSVPARGKNYAVLGLGRSGFSAARALKRAGAGLVLWDDNEKSREKAAEEGFTLLTPEDTDWSRLAGLVMSPGIPHSFPEPHRAATMAKQANVPLISDIDLLFQARPEACFVGITGTNGKSTTTTLVAHLLREAGRKVEVGGNLGYPVLDLEPLGADGIYVLELSSYQLELMPNSRPDLAMLLNITPDHLDRHGGMEGYQAAKARLFRPGLRGQQAIIDCGGPETAQICADWQREPADRRNALWVLAAEGETCPCSGMADRILSYRAGKVTLSDAASGTVEDYSLDGIETLRGTHNAQNAAAALAAGRALGLDPVQCRTGLASFPGLAHRQELVGRFQGVLCVNDSKATNADAASRALEAWAGTPERPSGRAVYWIAGGVAKDGGIESLSGWFPHLAGILLIGQARDDFAAIVAASGTSVPLWQCEELQEAVEVAFQEALARKMSEGSEAGNDPVLLFAPACASFDQYANFEKRGAHFRELCTARNG